MAASRSCSSNNAQRPTKRGFAFFIVNKDAVVEGGSSNGAPPVELNYVLRSQFAQTNDSVGPVPTHHEDDHLSVRTQVENVTMPAQEKGLSAPGNNAFLQNSVTSDIPETTHQSGATQNDDDFIQRLGAENDASYLQATFGQGGMGFEWKNQSAAWHLNLSADKWDHRIREPKGNENRAECCLRCHIQSLDYSDSEYFLLAISSHGREIRETEIIFSDCKCVCLSEIYEALSDVNCPTLKGKPKILVLQVCRVASREKG